MAAAAKSSVFRPQNVAFITGGASGIGFALAKKCASAGMRVAIADINRENLEAAKTKIEGLKTYELDVGKMEQWEGVGKAVLGDFGHIDLLALNAGFSPKPTTGSPWTDNSYFTSTLQTNLFGIIHGLTTLLPSLRASATPTNPPSIIITGSKQGITNPPGNPAYNASKAAVKSLAEGLSWELRHEPVNVHLLVPGWTYTGLSGAKPGEEEKGKPKGAWTPEQVVQFAVERIEGDDGEGGKKFWILVPDNDVSEELDRRRMTWGAGDAVYGRPPLSRWREEWKEKAEEGVKNLKL